MGGRCASRAAAPWLAVALLVVAVLVVVGPAATGLASPGHDLDPPPDLRGILDHGYILQDRNRDGHPDFVAARIVVPDDAAVAQVAAAANLAARLTFESYAVGLDLLAADDPEVAAEGLPLVVVGGARRLLEVAGVDPRGALADLAPGEGAVQWLSPSHRLPGGGVWVAGGDDTGLLAAADYLAGRYPALWLPDGQSYRELAEALTEYFTGEEEDAAEPPAGLILRRAVVSANRPGLVRASRALCPEEGPCPLSRGAVP